MDEVEALRQYEALRVMGDAAAARAYTAICSRLVAAGMSTEAAVAYLRGVADGAAATKGAHDGR